MCKQIINDDKKSREFAGDFDHHADAVVQCRAHCPMKHILGFARSQWMLPLGKILCHIINELIEITQNTNKTQL
jgi:hypothetical protein